MVRSFGIVALVVIGTVVAFAPVASAQVILGNYPPTNDSGTTADVNNLRWKALSFSMPPATSAPVGNLKVRLGDYDLVGETPTFEIRDHTGSTTAPGLSVLLSFTTPAPNGVAIQDYTFGPGAGFTLAGGHVVLAAHARRGRS